MLPDQVQPDSMHPMVGGHIGEDTASNPQFILRVNSTQSSYANNRIDLSTDGDADSKWRYSKDLTGSVVLYGSMLVDQVLGINNLVSSSPNNPIVITLNYNGASQRNIKVIVERIVEIAYHEGSSVHVRIYCDVIRQAANGVENVG